MCLIVNGCCGWNLRKSGLIIGWSYTIILTLRICYTILCLCLTDFDNRKIQRLEELTARDLIISHSIGEDIRNLVVSGIGIILSLLVIHGVRKEDRYFLLPWLVITGISFSIATPLFLIGSIVILSSLFKVEFILLFLFSILILVLNWWTWIVLYSLYKEMRNRNNMNKGKIIVGV